MLHKEILTTAQTRLLPCLSQFSKDFILVGGTAIALRLGHRRSLDFDLATNQEAALDDSKIRRKITKFKKIDRVIRNEKEEYTIIVDNIKLTFFYYPFKIVASEKFDRTFRLPDLLTLAAMKAYALGRRAKWKDYVDLRFIMKKHQGLKKMVSRARQIFSTEFNEKMFRAQLAYFQDVDYSEKVDYLKGFDVDDKTIEKELIAFSLK